MPTLAAWLHDLDPYAIRIADGFGVMWYGLSYAAGFAIAWLAVRFLAARGYTAFPPERAGDLVIQGAMGAVIGGRLGYVAFYQPELAIEFGRSFPFWGLLAINRGGMASHGGMIGVGVAGWLFARRGTENRPSVLHVYDCFALAAPFGLFLGRIANFVNGELLGRIVAPPGSPAPRWAVRFPQELRSGESGVSLLDDAQRGELASLLTSYAPESSYDAALDTVISQLQAGSAEVAAALGPLVSARHPSQLYQAAAEGVVVGAVLWVAARRPRRAGVVSAIFLVTYGLLRILTETVRLPDAHLEVARILNLSRGQWLSVLMIAAGVIMLVLLRRSARPLTPGWGRAERRESTPS
jgi:phosphatidylglycerol:prolipoprotein diacylglycerol transferase